MTNEEQIAALRSELASVEASLTQTEKALLTATPEDRMALSAVLIDLRADRTRLQFQLANLVAASVVVGPVGVTGTTRRAKPAAPPKPSASRSKPKSKPKAKAKPKARAKSKSRPKPKARRTKKAPVRRKAAKRVAKRTRRRR